MMPWVPMFQIFSARPCLPAQLRSVLALLVCGFVLALGGCNGSDSQENPARDGDAADASGGTDSGTPPTESLASTSNESATVPPTGSAAEMAGDRYQLPPGNEPRACLQALGEIDLQMRQVANGETELTTPAAIQSELQRLASLKREASDRIIGNPNAPPEALKQGKRGKLQALSHLTSLKPAQWAEALETYAESLAESTDPTLAVESRLVLIGFALNALQADDDPDRVVALVRQLSQNPSMLDMPALMAMGQARATLQQLGYSNSAREVRSSLVTAFESHPDANIRAMAQSLAQSERFDVLDNLRRDLQQGREVTPTQWQTAANNLVNRGADLMTLRYLSEAALFFEDTGRQQFAAATNAVIESGFANVDDPELRQECQMVLETYRARQEILGKPLDVNLPDTQGAAVPWQDFRGRVVLMPFWAAEHPESIQIFPLLEEIAAKFPQDVAIVGVNLDFEDAALQAFESEIQVDFPNLRSPSPDTQGLDNPLARQVGVTSFPFVVLVDREGKVYDVFMTGNGLAGAVESLLETTDEPAS